MGARFSGQCYGDQGAALSAYYSGVGPAVSAGSPSFVSVVTWTGTEWQVQDYSGGVLVSTSLAPVPAFEACDPGAGAVEGASLALLVVSVWVAAWAIRQMVRVMGVR